MSLYLDTSSLLRFLEESVATGPITDVLRSEARIIVSELTEFEARVHFQGALAGGFMRHNMLRLVQSDLERLRQTPPFQQLGTPTGLLRRALRELQTAQVHCRSFDRLHLVLMQELGIRRLMTHDHQQAKAALELGIEVLSP